MIEPAPPSPARKPQQGSSFIGHLALMLALVNDSTDLVEKLIRLICP